MNRHLAGVIPVFQTPYHADESIDFAALAMVMNQVGGGRSGLRALVAPASAAAVAA